MHNNWQVQSICWCALSKIVSLFVACLSVFISIWRGFKENGSCQEKKQMPGSLVLDPLSMLLELDKKLLLVYTQCVNDRILEDSLLAEVRCLKGLKGSGKCTISMRGRSCEENQHVGGQIEKNCFLFPFPIWHTLVTCHGHPSRLQRCWLVCQCANLLASVDATLIQGSVSIKGVCWRTNKQSHPGQGQTNEVSPTESVGVCSERGQTD